MPSSYHRRFREHSAPAFFAIASALLLAIGGSIDVAAAQSEASARRQQLEQLRDVNADARRNADELRRQMDELQAEDTDRGLLLTLEDAVFVTNETGLSSAGQRRLGALVAFLGQYPQRTVAVDGHAGVGGYRYDQALSKRRADAIKAYLIQRGVASRRLAGRGNSEAPQGYDSASQQQPQRRVEVLIVDPLTSVAGPDTTAAGT